MLLWCHYCMCMLRGPVGRLGHGLKPSPSKKQTKQNKKQTNKKIQKCAYFFFSSLLPFLLPPLLRSVHFFLPFLSCYLFVAVFFLFRLSFLPLSLHLRIFFLMLLVLRHRLLLLPLPISFSSSDLQLLLFQCPLSPV